MAGNRLDCRLKAIRQERGLAQADVAIAVGLTRQAIGAIESGAYVPNTAVALDLARLLGVRVEDLFCSSSSTGLLSLSRLTAPASGRIGIAQVRDAVIGFPLAGMAQVRSAFAGADALLTADGSAVRPLFPAEQLQHTAVLMGCDPAFAILSDLVGCAAPARLIWTFAPSQRALDAVAHGDVHVAGTHLIDVATGTSDLVPARAALARTGGVIVAFASWAQGLMVARGNPRELRTVADLARPGVRCVNREPGSGSRTVLDTLLHRAGIPSSAVPGYRSLVGSHLEGARVVASGNADAAIGLEVSAVACGLDFVPLVTVRCDLVLPRDLQTHAAIVTMLDVLAGAPLRERLAALPGYDTSCTGTMIARVPAP